MSTYNTHKWDKQNKIFLYLYCFKVIQVLNWTLIIVAHVFCGTIDLLYNIYLNKYILTLATKQQTAYCYKYTHIDCTRIHVSIVLVCM